MCTQAGTPSNTGYTTLQSFNRSLSTLGEITPAFSIPGWEAEVLWDLCLLETGMGVPEGAPATLGPLRQEVFASSHSATWVTIKDEVPEPWHHLFPP